jgi:hypothetical protein
MEQMAGARLEFDAIRGEDTNLTVGATYYAAGIGGWAELQLRRRASRGCQHRPRGCVSARDIKAKFAGVQHRRRVRPERLLLRDTNRVLSKDNWALDANLGYNFGPNLGITAGLP